MIVCEHIDPFALVFGRGRGRGRHLPSRACVISDDGIELELLTKDGRTYPERRLYRDFTLSYDQEREPHRKWTVSRYVDNAFTLETREIEQRIADACADFALACTPDSESSCFFMDTSSFADARALVDIAYDLDLFR